MKTFQLAAAILALGAWVLSPQPSLAQSSAPDTGRLAVPPDFAANSKKASPAAKPAARSEAVRPAKQMRAETAAASPAPPVSAAHPAAKPAARSDAVRPAKRVRVETAAAALPVSATHRLILQVNSNDPAAMNLALNNATNVAQYYKERGDRAKIEIVTFGPGLHMLRDDTSPVKSRLEEMALSTPEVAFKACGNTREKMSKAESKEIPLVAQANVVDSGVVRVMELQEKGWSYVKP